MSYRLRSRRPKEDSVHNGALRALAFALLLLLAVPAAAGASTVSVEPFREPPDIDPFGSCTRYMMCPEDMLVLTAASGEINHVAITEAVASFGQNRYLVRDKSAPVVAGPGCERVEEPPQPPPAGAVVCTAAAIGPQQLGDGPDWITSPGGWVSGDDGDDVITVSSGDADGGEGDDVIVASGEANGEEGDDVLIGQQGAGGSGNDVLLGSGRGGAGDDMLSCFPHRSGCHLNGGPGDDVLTGHTGRDRLFGEGGRDLVRGGARDDLLDGGPGNDRLIGGASPDVLAGGAGADRLDASEDRSAGETPKKDRVDCGIGRRDQATVDRRDRVKRCERVTRRLNRAG